MTATIQSEAERAWSFGFSAYAYMVPDSCEYVPPTLNPFEGTPTFVIAAGVSF